MDYKVLKTKDCQSITVDTVTIRDICKTSNTRDFFTMDIYYLDEKKRVPLLVESPILTIGSSIFNNNNRSFFFVSLRNIEYDKNIQDFYKLITSIEYSIIKRLSDKYPLSENYINDKNIDVSKEYNFFIDTDKYISISVEYKKEIVSMYDRFKNKINKEELIVKHNRAQFILELPSVWFELDEEKQISKIGFKWSVLQIKIVEQCSVQICLFEDDKPKMSTGPPVPSMSFGPPASIFSNIGNINPLQKIQMGDLLGGIGSLRKTEPNKKEIKEIKSIEKGGIRPPSLNDILGGIGSLKKIVPLENDHKKQLSIPQMGGFRPPSLNDILSTLKSLKKQ